MATDTEAALRQLEILFDNQRLAVLSTQKNTQPYASLVAFAATDDLKQLIFLTPKTTRKYDNLAASPQVAVLVHNSENKADDVVDAVSVTALGEAVVMAGAKKQKYLDIYLKRHPHLNFFSEAPTTALVVVNIHSYVLVSHFQNVIELRMKG